MAGKPLSAQTVIAAFGKSFSKYLYF